MNSQLNFIKMYKIELVIQEYLLILPKIIINTTKK